MKVGLLKKKNKNKQKQTKNKTKQNLKQLQQSIVKPIIHCTFQMLRGFE
jgi:hypothetical protein